MDDIKVGDEYIAIRRGWRGLMDEKRIIVKKVGRKYAYFVESDRAHRDPSPNERFDIETGYVYNNPNASERVMIPAAAKDEEEKRRRSDALARIQSHGLRNDYANKLDLTLDQIERIAAICAEGDA